MSETPPPYVFRCSECDATEDLEHCETCGFEYCQRCFPLHALDAEELAELQTRDE